MAYQEVPAIEEKKSPAAPFPVTHGKCPVCGSTRGLYQETVERLKKESLLPTGYDLKGVALQAPLVDANHPPTILASTVDLRVLQMTLEVCAEPNCGAVYCNHFDILKAVGKAQMPPHGFRR